MTATPRGATGVQRRLPHPGALGASARRQGCPTRPVRLRGTARSRAPEPATTATWCPATVARRTAPGSSSAGGARVPGRAASRWRRRRPRRARRRRRAGAGDLRRRRERERVRPHRVYPGLPRPPRLRRWRPRRGLGEECDDGGLEPYDGCEPDCRVDPFFVCGDGVGAAPGRRGVRPRHEPRGLGRLHPRLPARAPLRWTAWCCPPRAVRRRPVNDGSYGRCAPGCVLGPYCGDGGGAGGRGVRRCGRLQRVCRLRVL
jgi:cysteine-rich repeat protein